MATQSTIGNADLKHMLAKTREAAAFGPGALSTGEVLAAALILNRPDWLLDRNYTIAEALDRIGPEWAKLIPAAANQFKQDCDVETYKKAIEEHRDRLAAFSRRGKADDETLEFAAQRVTSRSAPGYRDVYLTFDLEPKGEGPTSRIRATLSLRAEDGESIIRDILDVHRFAWRKDSPIDLKPGEQRPRWLDSL